MGQTLIKNNLDKPIRVQISSSKEPIDLTMVNDREQHELPDDFDSTQHKMFYFHPKYKINPDFSNVIKEIAPSQEVPFSGYFQSEYAFITVWKKNANEPWLLYCENHPIKRSSVVSISSGSNKPIELIPNSRFCSASKDIRKVTVKNKGDKVWVRIDTDDRSETKKALLPHEGKCEDGNIKDPVYCRTGRGQGYTEIDTDKEIDFYLNPSNSIIYLSIDYERNKTIHKHCIHHPFAYIKGGEYPSIVITNLLDGIYPRINKRDINNSALSFPKISKLFGSLTSSVSITNKVGKNIRVKIDYRRSTEELFKINDNVGNWRDDYDIRYAVPATDSFTTICYDYHMEFNLPSNEDQYALTIWVKEGESWILWYEDHPIPKFSDITVFHNSDDKPLEITPKDHDSTSQKNLTKIQISNEILEKIWVKIGPKDEDDNDAKGRPSGNSDAVFSPSNPFNNISQEVFRRAGEQRGYTEISKGKSIVFFPNISKDNIFITVRYKKERGKLDECICIPLTEENKDKDFSSEIKDAVKGALLSHEPNGEENPELEQDLKDDTN